MTLVARNPPKPLAHHKKISGKHHRQSKSYRKPYWPYLPLLAVVGIGLFLNSSLPGKHPVLGYATDMSIQSLLDDTNAQRGANNESALAINNLLDNAAQSKAADMASRDYWSHNTPDGKTPWSFMAAAGYNYQLAGENLAYGFATAADTLTGWMNSPEHKANILNAGYTDVGFGFINISNYQSTGPETLVVAMYGKPANVAAAVPTPAPTPPTITGSATTPAAGADTSNHSSGQNTSLAASPTPPVDPIIPTSADTVTPATSKKSQSANLITETKAEKINRGQVLTAGTAPWSMFVVSLAGSAALVFFLLRHGFAWRKVIVKGEEFVLHHPVLDITLVGIATIAFLLARGSGVIR